MTTVANASVVFKDKNGNVGTVKGASANDITKISNAISDVAQVVNPTTHLPIQATTSSVGVVQLADSAAVSAGTSGRVVDAAQLKDAIEHVTPAGNLMTTDTAQTVTAVKTFSSLPESSVVPTTNNQLVNKKYVDDHTPTGFIGLWGEDTLPEGWLLCNGAAVSRSTYAGLFAKIGTKYGTGDGSTTFNLPDFRDRYPIGSGTNLTGTQVSEQLPNISGALHNHIPGAEYCFISSSGAFTLSNYISSSVVYSGTDRLYRYATANLDANSSSVVYTNNGVVHPLSLALNYIIKI